MNALSTRALCLAFARDMLVCMAFVVVCINALGAR